MPTIHTPSIPKGYTFLNPKTFVSERAKTLIGEMLDKADNRNPDAHDMYIYNDFYNYAILDIIDHALSTIHARIKKREWDEAYFQLEALTIFQKIESQWPMIDDPDRPALTNKAYGACLVATLRTLSEEGRLDRANFPSLETLLSRAASWGKDMFSISAGSDYHLVCKGIGQRLFAHKSAQEKALEKKMAQEWLDSLDAENKAAMEEDDDEEDSDDEDGRPWYSGKANEHDNDDDYKITKTWKAYKEHLASYPTKPLRGPPKWDLTKWTQAEKAPFLFSNHGNDDDDDMGFY
ncbi:hypothetical protein BOTBODRAFT_29001 [Botryobasidium botryosum FD-172 SS1]|uniref:Uncharacterized protein n=1 Tax=Botryobasidium botryosum (strain FD-172 SS1) TaxID=930990 RepID=A0A067N3A1_BOTB1|nr:hypothetical protein BOTBODRAFT_29001 [Botryobasidium botryosum FD-172 SS1]